MTACLTDPEREKFLLRVHRVSVFTGRVNPEFAKNSVRATGFGLRVSPIYGPGLLRVYSGFAPG